MTEVLGTAQNIENCIQYLVLGVIQGITEFLPISSTAHLKALPLMLGWQDPGVSVSAAIQLGSIAAVIIYFKKDLKKIWKGFFQIRKGKESKSNNSLLGETLLLGTIPILLAGFGIKIFWPDFENSIFRSLNSIGIVSIIMAFVLLYAEKYGIRKKYFSDLKRKDGIAIGLGQMLAIIPGVSRSGVTLSTALILGFKRQDAARFSFLLGIPSISIAGLSEIKNALRISTGYDLLPITIGIITSAIVSWLAIDWMIKYLQKNNTYIFILYRILFGIISLFWHA
tara:strand:+ start:131 stop:976 length:846 start_codon:yes stop_codon:yes gene_type:complete